MAELPVGTVTFLFTDIEGSTQLLKHLGDGYAEVLAEHQRIIRSAAEERGGREIDTQGDSFFFAFARANAALGAAVAGQRALAEHPWPEGANVRVRMGLHTGEPLVGEERYVGMGVHRAARIGAVGHGGQVLLSSATRELVEDEVGGVSIRDLGTYKLKDIERPEHLFQLDIEGLRTAFPPLNVERIAPPRTVRRRTVLLAGLAGVLAAAVAIPVFALGQGGSGETLEALAGNSVGIVDAESGRIVGDVTVGTAPSGVTLGDGAAWVANSADGTVDRVDLATRTVRQTIPVGSGPRGIAYGEGAVWVANGSARTVSRIDPRSNLEAERISVGNGPTGIAVGMGKVWVVNRDDHTLSRIDPDSGDVEREFDVGPGPVEVAVAGGSLWVSSQTDGKVHQVEPRTGAVLTSVPVGRGPGPMSATTNAVWVANTVDGSVSRIDPEKAAVVATVPVGEGPSGIAAGPDAVWVSNEFDGSIDRIDPATNLVAESVSVGGSPAGIAAGPEGVFVTVRPSGDAHRGGTLIVHDYPHASGYPTFDPAQGAPHYSVRLSVLYDGLTAFRHVGGHEGAELVPDLATAIPEPTNAGKTYVFRIRDGIRYSNGQLVKAGDIRRALERTFAQESYGAPFYEAIVGADSCLRRPKTCDLSKGIETDNGAGTVTFHLTKPDREFAVKLALSFAFAVPESIPNRDMGTHALPATGPYRIASYAKGRQLRFVRNPFFREWSRVARPDGYADEIVVKLGVSASQQARAVEQGGADLAELGNTAFPGVSRLRVRYGTRLHSSPGPYVVYTFLNTQLPPFDDIRVRKALNYAVDRDAVARAAGPEMAAPTCRILPQNYPSYRPECPYERDLDEARRLVAASGTSGSGVVVWTREAYRPFYIHVVRALQSLGYRARLQVVDDAGYYSAVAKAGPTKIQAGYIAWIGDYPSAFGYLNGLLRVLRGPLLPSQFSDRAIQREIERAIDLQQVDPSEANERWAEIDRMVLDRAPVVPMYDLRAVQFVSERVGNYQYHPQWEILLDQLWVR